MQMPFRCCDYMEMDAGGLGKKYVACSAESHWVVVVDYIALALLSFVGHARLLDDGDIRDLSDHEDRHCVQVGQEFGTFVDDRVIDSHWEAVFDWVVPSDY